jgi:hypothetical protein
MRAQLRPHNILADYALEDFEREDFKRGTIRSLLKCVHVFYFTAASLAERANAFTSRHSMRRPIRP